MKITGTGSRLSPIAIDDSEDEVLQELVGDPNSSPTTNQRDDNFPPRNGTSNDVFKGSYHNLKHEGKQAPKRKRVANDTHGGPIASSSQQRLDSVDHTSPAALSKKAKKRRRKMERLAQELGNQPSRQAQTWMNGTSYLLPGLATAPQLSSWGIFGEPASQPINLMDAYSAYAISQHNPKIASSSSSWVASMAMAAETPTPERHEPETWHSHLPVRSNKPKRYDHDIHPIAEPMAAPGPPPAPPPAPIPPLPPSPVQPIGMKPDYDPSSKHGLFVIPPGTSRGSGATSTSKGTYIPNPARTLVMEQLPKSHRTQEFVNNWSKSACGAHPVFLCIDSHGAKALVEFATAELARRAWSSPRLGAELVGVKTHHLKGRPREDLIKVWWYRVDGIGAGAGVGEIEEGEIEGDAGEKEIEVPVKKETKKEKKARLQRERLAKKAAAATPLNVPQQQQAFEVDTEAAKAPTLATTPTPSLPLVPPSESTTHSPVEQNTAVYPYYPIIPQPLPHPLPPRQFVPVRLPSLPRAPLVPQSALEAQWRPKHELPEKPSLETIISAPPIREVYTAFSASSKSSLPPPQSIEAVPPPKWNPPESPTYEDMDVDVDMDLESPSTSKNSAFDFFSMQNHTQAENPLSPSLTMRLAPDVTLDSIIPPNSITSHVDAPSEPTAPLDDTHTTTASLSSHESPLDSLAPSPPAAITSPPLSASGAPPLEPRAMKNAPKGPSYAKRSLLARQKELEERIARSKKELGIIASLEPPVGSVELPASNPVSPAVENQETSKQAMERLRSLVLRSQKSRIKSSGPATPSEVPDPSPINSQSPANVPFGPAASVSSIPSSQTPTFSLDDLATSFITETIETFKAAPTPALRTPAPPTQATAPPLLPQDLDPAAAVKLELAERQKRLEAQIAESKTLMLKLSNARTKHERETILAAMREQSRSASESSTPAQIQAPVQMAPKLKSQLFADLDNPVLAVKKWPGSHEHAGVLIVSDDEEDDESDSHD